MPLIDLKTDLKSLRFGMDRPGMGSSQQPFSIPFQKDLNDIKTEDLGQNVLK